MDKLEFATKVISNLEKENKKLKRERIESTPIDKEELILKIQLFNGGSAEQIYTGIYLPRTMKDYYLPTQYIEPLKVQLIDYGVSMGAENQIAITATVFAENRLIKHININDLFKSKNKASEYYLHNKDKLDYGFIFEEIK